MGCRLVRTELVRLQREQFLLPQSMARARQHQEFVVPNARVLLATTFLRSHLEFHQATLQLTATRMVRECSCDAPDASSTKCLRREEVEVALTMQQALEFLPSPSTGEPWS